MDSFLADKYGIGTHSQKPTWYQRTALRAMNVLEYKSGTVIKQGWEYQSVSKKDQTVYYKI